MNKVKYAHIYTDSEGESHVEDLELDLAEANYAPPAPSLWVSAFFPAAEYHYLGAPSGWSGDWHPVPRRQVFFYLRGKSGVELSDGASRRLGPGDVLLAEDTNGKGHRSWVVGDEDVLAVVVELG
jgi:hypothetical protein